MPDNNKSRKIELEIEIRESLYKIYFNNWPEGADAELQKILNVRLKNELLISK